MARSQRWFLLPVVLAVVIWFAWSREREGGGHAGGAADPGTSTGSVASELARPGSSGDGDAASASDRVPEPETRAGERSVTIRVRVLEEASRRPIPGALVRWFERELETDADGECEAACPEAVRWPDFHVAKEGFVHLWTRLERKPELEVTLSRGATLSGRVLADDAGAPVAGARLSVERALCRCPVDVVESDASGRYELPCVPRGDATQIVIQAEGFPRMERDFELRSDEPRIEQDFRLERGIEIAGRVADFTGGAGVAGALVAHFPADDSGRFRSWVAADPTSGEVHVSVSAPGHCRLDAVYGREDLERGGALEFRLPRTVAVEGVVRDAAGNPLMGAYVGTEEEREPRDLDGDVDPVRAELPLNCTIGMEQVEQSNKTDAAGRFRIEGLLPWDRHLSVWAGMEGYELVEQRPGTLGAPGSTTWLEFEIHPENSDVATLRGDVSVNGLTGSWEGTLSWKGPTREGRVELDRGFYVEVEPGEVHFHLALQSLPGPIEGDTFVLGLAQGTYTDHDVELRLPPDPILGHVRYRDGTPVASASIRARSVPGGREPGVSLSAESDAAGAFRLDVPDLGLRYRIEASVGHQSATLSDVDAGATELELVISRQGKILFRVREARTGASLDPVDCALRWRSSGEAEFERWGRGLLDRPDLDGWFADELPAGWLDLECRRHASDYLPLLLEHVWIPEGPDPARIEFLLDPGLRVRVQRADGQERWPAEHALFLVDEKSWDDVLASLQPGYSSDLYPPRHLARFDEHGGATIQGLAPGHFRFLVVPGDLTVDPAEIELPAKESEPVLVRWERR